MIPAAAATETIVELDLRGLKCPMPVLRSRRALARLAPGTVLRVWTTDPMAAVDLPHLARQSGDFLRGQTRHGWGLVFEIVKGAL